MLRAFWRNEPRQYKALGSKTTLAVAGQGLGEGKTELGVNIQKQLAKRGFLIDERFRDIRERFLDAVYIRIVLNDGARSPLF